MGVKDGIRWEIQWHPASGARVCRLVVTWRGARRLILALGIGGLVIIAGGLLAGLDGFLTRRAVDAARSENRALSTQREVLREQAFDLTERFREGVERGHRAARLAGTPGRAFEGQSLRRPARDAGDKAILTWLSAQSARLKALENELAARRIDIRGKQAPVTAPLAKGKLPARNATVLQVALTIR